MQYKVGGAGNVVLAGKNNPAAAFGGFICTAGGTFALLDADGSFIIGTMTLAANAYVPGGFVCPNGLTASFGGGCIGTLIFCG